MHINEVVKQAYELMRAEMIDTVLALPEEIRPNLSTDILYGVITDKNVVAKLANKIEIETKMKPMTYGVETVKHTNW